MRSSPIPPSAAQAKTIRQFVLELEAFENPLLRVEISLDGGMDHRPISLVTKADNRFCVLENLERSYTGEKTPEFVVRGKTIEQLLKELRTFENQDLFVEMSIDNGHTRHPIVNAEIRNDLILLKGRRRPFEASLG